MIKRLVVVDGNPPWIRSLFLAMPQRIDVRILRIGNPHVFKRQSDKRWLAARRWTPLAANVHERWIIVPGLVKTPTLTAWLVRRAMMSAAGNRREAAVVFTLPQYAQVAERATNITCAYDAHDVFSLYSWDQQRIIEQEARLMNACCVNFAVARAVRDDLAPRTTRPVLYSPMAVSAGFVKRLRNEVLPCPSDIAGLPRPIIGCTGQINQTYDWVLLEELSKLMSQASFVFVGPIIAETTEHRAMIDAVFKDRPNMHWLDRKPHAELPAYLQNFDACLNPLTPGHHADRRSPLRLFDYLATDKPIISTDIAEAPHEGHVWIGRSAAEMAEILQQAFGGQRRIHVAARRKYIDENTWQARATQILTAIEEYR